MSQLAYAQGKRIPKFKETRILDEVLTVILSLVAIILIAVVGLHFSRAYKSTISIQSFKGLRKVQFFSTVSELQLKERGLELLNDVLPAKESPESHRAGLMHQRLVSAGTVRKSNSQITGEVNKNRSQPGVLVLSEQVPAKALLSVAENTAGSTGKNALCPVDMQIGHLIENGMFGENPNYPYHNGFHEGIDIFGPRGVELVSPHVCRIESIRISSIGAHSVFLYCPDLETPRVEFGHVDLTINDYETLRWYGVSFAAFHHAVQTRAVYIDSPTEHLDFMQPGESTHIYMGDTGAKSVHLHLEIKQDQYAPPVDPCLVFDCCE